MERLSFLGGRQEELVRYVWDVAGLGKRDIGFGICLDSGLVFQTTTISREEMLFYYKNFATYVNPDISSGFPTNNKVKDVKRLLSLVTDTMGGVPKRVFQIGSSDGYTLSVFKDAGSTSVLGVEPSVQAREYSALTYGVTAIDSTAEEYICNEKFDLVIATHVLEHLYDPLAVLMKLKNNISDDGVILIEVPLWERDSLQPNGILSFEHLNYFNENALVFMLGKAGFDVQLLSKYYHVNNYPVVTVLAKKNSGFFVHDTYSGRGLLESVIRSEPDSYTQVAP